MQMPCARSPRTGAVLIHVERRGEGADRVGNVVGAVREGHGARGQHLQDLEDLLGAGVKLLRRVCDVSGVVSGAVVCGP